MENKLKNQDDFNQYTIIGSKIEQFDWYFGRNDFCIKGKYDKTQDTEKNQCYYYDLYFKRIKNIDIIEENYQNANVIEFEVNAVDSGFDIRLTIDCGHDDIETIQFWCQDMDYNIFKYRGMSYKNMYFTPQYQALFTKNRQACCNENFLKTKHRDLGDGYCVWADSYGTWHTAKNGGYYKDLFIQKCRLLHKEKVILEYDSIYDMMVKVPAIIKHQNEKQYFLYKTDLYGLNVYDIESKEAFYYVPEGYQHYYKQICGESFIITAIYYDNKTDLIAYEGCYWGGSSDVMVGDFSNPMNFNPILQSIHDLIDPEYEYYDDIDFGSWEDEKLCVIVDGQKDKIKPVDIIDIKMLLKKCYKKIKNT